MSNLNIYEPSYNLSLNQLCHIINEDTLQNALKSSTPYTCIQIIWKVLGLNERINHLSTVELGYEIAAMGFEPTQICMSSDLFEPENFERFATNRQALFFDHFNCSSLFDHQLFFKLVSENYSRSHLFILFQIWIQIKGFDFPSKFAQEWVNMEKPDSNEGMCLPDIENGLKLGIFLGDAGWLPESALVLSHTYEIITTKWVCHDEIVEQFKTLQCLTKWLLVASNYCNFVEAKVVLQNLIKTIDVIEQIEERTLSISYSYLAVSQYYYVLLEFDKAWSWAVKAILELHMASGDLKILTLSHSIKLCCALYKFNMAQKFCEQLQIFQYSQDYNAYVEIFLSNANLCFNVEDPESGIHYYYDALGTAEFIFGYCNLNTAIILMNYAFDRHKYHSNLDDCESLRCILQAIFIMQKIGVPNDNMLLVNAHLIKSLIIQEQIFEMGQEDSDYYIYAEDDMDWRPDPNEIENMKQFFFQTVEATCFNALQVASHSLGENNLVTAKAYQYIGSIYIFQEKYTESEKMYLKEIEIIKSILGTNSAEFANSTGHLANLYTYYLHKFQEAEVLLLQTIKIYESICDGPIAEYELSIEGLICIYKELNNMERFNYYTNYLETVAATYDHWLYAFQSRIPEENCSNVNLSLEKFKCILHGCSCGQ